MKLSVGLEIVVGLVAAFAGGIASIAGFGIGSLLTPLLASHYDMRAAVGAVSIPHVIATAIRFWKLATTSTEKCFSDSVR